MPRYESETVSLTYVRLIEYGFSDRTARAITRAMALYSKADQQAMFKAFHAYLRRKAG